MTDITTSQKTEPKAHIFLTLGEATPRTVMLMAPELQVYISDSKSDQESWQLFR